jgi:hypothetical protein
VVTPDVAGGFMVSIQMLALLNNVVSQLAPVLIPLLFSLLVLLIALTKKVLDRIAKRGQALSKEEVRQGGGERA